MRQRFLIIGIALFMAGSALAEPLRVMTYNVWLGFGKKKTIDAGIKWIASQNCAVIALQELKGFNQKRLKIVAQKWGHNYAVIFDRKGGFPQGLTSKTPIEKIEQIQPENNPKLRGTLHCKTAGIHFFIVHFDPHNYLHRRKEASAVAKRVIPLVKTGEKVIVLGDFNAHSIADKEFLASQTVLLEKLRAKEDSRHRAFDENGNLDFSTVQTLLDAGLTDPSTHSLPTFPTRLLFQETDPAEFSCLQERIDFILVSPPLAGGIILYPRDEVLNTISDHYPVIFELK